MIVFITGALVPIPNSYLRAIAHDTNLCDHGRRYYYPKCSISIPYLQRYKQLLAPGNMGKGGRESAEELKNRCWVMINTRYDPLVAIINGLNTTAQEALRHISGDGLVFM